MPKNASNILLVGTKNVQPFRTFKVMVFILCCLFLFYGVWKEKNLDGKSEGQTLS